MHIASCSWSDHLSFGEGDGRLATPDAVRRRLDAWRDGLGTSIVHWRVSRTRIAGHFMAAPGYQHPSERSARDLGWDELSVVPQLAHEAGLEAWLYVSVFDEGWPLGDAAERAVSFHNAMHAQHVAWQSTFSREHPDFAVTDRTGTARQPGVLCLGYREVRAELVARWTGLLSLGAWDGLFLCLRSQSRPADHADQFGFNPPVRNAFLEQEGRDLLAEPFDVQCWRDLRGRFLTTLLSEVAGALDGAGTRVGVGMARGDVIGPPLGNMTLHWRDWIEHGLVDTLVVGQNSSQCPSMWHQLWPMHRGTGYVQDHLTGAGMPTIEEQLTSAYGPVLARGRTRLFVARQWSHPSAGEEAALVAHPAVTGLAFSTFRFDNGAAVARNDWRA